MDRWSQQSLGYIAHTNTLKGLGVFAAREIAAGEVVEIAPVLQVRCDYDELHSELKTRVFNWEHLAQQTDTHAVALGYGSMYNHANPANMRYYSTAAGQAICFEAVRHIHAGEELTINYDGEKGAPTSSDESWFEANGITAIR